MSTKQFTRPIKYTLEFCTGAVMGSFGRLIAGVGMNSSRSTGRCGMVYSTREYPGNGNTFAGITAREWGTYVSLSVSTLDYSL